MNSMKNALRVISPIIIYLCVEQVVGFLINFFYTMSIYDSSKEWSQEVENELYEALYEMLSKNMILITGVISVICLLIFYIMMNREWRKRTYYIEETRPVYVKYLYVAAASIGLTVAANLAINAFEVFSYAGDYTQIADELYSEPLYLQILIIGILAPVCEELMFRGLIYERLTSFSNPRSAMIVTSILFGVFHGTMIQIIYAFFFSLFMIYAYRRAGSFLAPVMFHIISNLTCIVLSQIDPLSSMGYSIGIVLFAMIGMYGLYMLKNGHFFTVIHTDNRQMDRNLGEMPD